MKIIEQNYSIIVIDFIDKFEINFLNMLINNEFKNKKIKIFSFKELDGFNEDYFILNKKENILLEIEKHLNPGENIFLIGIENLLEYTNPLFSHKLKNRTINIYDKTAYEFESLSVYLLDIKKYFKTNNLIPFINTSYFFRAKIENAFQKNGNPEINFIFKDENTNELETLKLLKKVFMEETNLESAIKLIESEKKSFYFNLPHMLALIHLKFKTPIDKIITQLEKDFDRLDLQGKKLLVDLLLELDEMDKAFKLTNDLIKDSPLNTSILKNLSECIEKSNLSEKKKIEQLREITKITKEPYSLEILANCLNNNHNYKEAASVRREIEQLTKCTYHELIARILDLLENTPKDFNVCKDYIKQFLLNNPKYKDEAYYRLGLMAIINYKSPYLSYECFKKVNIQALKIEERIKMTQTLFKIFSDTNNSKKALGKLNLSRIAHLIALKKERIKILIEGIKIMSYNNNFYIHYEDFLKSQSTESWKTSLHKYFQEIVFSLKDTNFKSLKKESLLFELSKSKLNYNKDTKLEELDFKSILHMIKTFVEEEAEDASNIIKTALTLFTVNSDFRGLIWGHFYNSLLLAKTNPQDSIDNALTCFYYIESLENEYLKKEAQMLGLIAWGNIKYRIGNEVEGMACILAALEIGVDIKEIVIPFQVGSLIISKFFSENDFELNEITEELIIYNNYYNQIFDNDLKGLEILITPKDCYKDLLKNNLSKEDPRYYEYLFSNIQILAQRRLYKEANKLIIKNSDGLIKFLKKRKDIFSKALNSLFEILNIGHDEIINFKVKTNLQYKFIKESFNSLEEQRKLLKFSQERTGFFDANINIYKNYIFYLVFINKLNYFDTPVLYELERAFSIFSLRGLYETREEADDSISHEMDSFKKKSEILLKKSSRIINRDNSTYSTISRRIDKISNILKMYHPYFKETKSFSYISLYEVQKLLSKEDVIFQYVLTKVGIVYILVTHNTISIDIISIDSRKVLETDRNFGQIIQNYKMDRKINKASKLASTLSSNIFSPLLKFLKGNKNKTKLYIIQDFELKYSSINFLETYEQIISKNLKSIKYIGNLKSLTNNNNNPSKKIHMKIVGNNINLKKFEELSLKHSNILSKIEEPNNDFLDTLIIIGHGVPDAGSSNRAALKIMGDGVEISINEIYPLEKVNNLILLSCGSGLSLETQIETNNGVLGELIKSKIKNILLCKWDVPISESFKLIDYYLEFYTNNPEEDFHTTINNVRKKLILDTSHLGEWAGFETWLL